MTVAQVLGLLGGVITVVAALSAAYLVLKSTLAKTTTSLWKDEAEALRVRLVTVEKSDSDCKERLSGIEAANKVLSDQVSGAGAVAMLGLKMEGHFSSLLEEMKRGNKAAEGSATKAASEIVEHR